MPISGCAYRHYQFEKIYMIANVDICTRSIEEALDVLAMSKRMVATLRG